MKGENNADEKKHSNIFGRTRKWKQKSNQVNVIEIFKVT